MKILKTKTYRKMQEQIERLTKQILKQQNELKQLKDINKELGDNIEKFEIAFNNKVVEIRKLKSLLSKNKIDYKYLYKKESK